jgi:hypothetical protein
VLSPSLFSPSRSNHNVISSAKGAYQTNVVSIGHPLFIR